MGWTSLTGGSMRAARHGTNRWRLVAGWLVTLGACSEPDATVTQADARSDVSPGSDASTVSDASGVDISEAVDVPVDVSASLDASPDPDLAVYDAGDGADEGEDALTLTDTETSSDVGAETDVEQDFDTELGMSDVDDDVADVTTDPCMEAFAGCLPEHTALAENFCSTAGPDDPCAAVLIKNFEVSGCASPCLLALPGLEPICVLPECAAFRDFLGESGVLGDQCTTCACIPYCDGKACGSDGCTGSCGTCGEGSFCDGAGQCEPVAESCKGLSPQGCCSAADAAVYCDQGTPTVESCAAPSACAWSKVLGRFACIAETAATPPWLSSSCPSSACLPVPEVCDGLPQQCTESIDAADPDAMCSLTHPDATGLPETGGWTCDAPAQGVDGCRVQTCAPEYFDVNGAPADGCECKGSAHAAISPLCGYGGPGSINELAFGEVRDGPDGVIPLPDDGVGGGNEDWYYVSIADDGKPLGTIIVDFSVNSGLDYGFEVRTLCQNAPFEGLASAFGLGAPPARSWRYSSAGLPSVDVFEAAGTGPWLSYFVVRVFRVESNAECNSYRLRVRRQ